MRTWTAVGAERLRPEFELCLVAPTGAVVETVVADSIRLRVLGLAGLAFAPRPLLLIPRCSSVHTVGMRFAIDVVFVSWPPRDGGEVAVADVHRQLHPGRVAVAAGGLMRPGRHAALELAAGRAQGLRLEKGETARVLQDSAGPVADQRVGLWVLR